MERITFEGNFCDIAQCVGEPGNTSECESGFCDQRRTWERLKQYEDTGLSPEVIAELIAEKPCVLCKHRIGKVCGHHLCEDGDEREKLIELLDGVQDYGFFRSTAEEPQGRVINSIIADHLIANGVTVQQWIPVSEPPKKNGYYLCWILFSAVGERKEYRQKISFWEDNLWLESARSFHKEYPLYWMHLPQPPKEE